MNELRSQSFAGLAVASLLALGSAGAALAQPAGQFKSLSHNIHAVNDLDTTLAFYREVFGFEGRALDFANPAVPLLTNAPGVTLRMSMLTLPGGTRYELTHDPFVAFDIMREGHERASVDELTERVSGRLVIPKLLHSGGPFSIENALKLLGKFGFHGALDAVEGAVWRVERRGKVDFLAKYVRPDKVDGLYLPEISGQPPVWNWRPTK